VVDGNIQKARENIFQLFSILNQKVIGRETENRLLITSLIAHENVAYIGPPGTAKSYTIRLIAKLVDASFAAYQFTRFTSDVEVIGPFDIPALTQRGELKRNLSRLFKADIAYLDEAFKSSSAILNALLSALQERVIYDPVTGNEIAVNTKWFIVTSNEVPQDEELQALYDRFPIRIFVKYLDDDAAFLSALEARWLSNGNITAVARWEDVETLNTYTQQILASTIKSLNKRFVDIYHSSTISFIKSLRSKGIMVSDRTVIEKLPKLVSAKCSLEGLTVENVINGVIDFLPHLARDASEAEEIRKAILEIMGEIAELHNKLNQAKALVRAGRLDEASRALEEILTFDVNQLASKPWLKSRVEIILREAKSMLDKVNQIKSTLEAMAQ